MQNNPDKTKILNVIKIAADIGRKAPLMNALNRQAIRFNRGDAVRFDVSLLENGTPIDVSKISTINIEIFDIGAPNAPEPRTASLLVQKTATASDIESVEAEELDTGKCNAAFILDENDTNMDSGFKWMKISSLSADTMRSTFSQGWIEIEESYLSAGEADRLPPEIYLTKDAALSLFLAKEDNLLDLSDKSEARKNIQTYSSSEVDNLIAVHEHSQYLSSAEAENLYCTKNESASIAGNVENISDEVSALASQTVDLSREIERNKEIVEDFACVRMKSGTISVDVKGMDSVPFSICFSYKRKADWQNGDYFFDKSSAVGSAVNGFNILCGNNGEFIKFLFRTNCNTGYASALSFEKSKFPCDGKWHSVVMTVKDKYIENMKCFLDGIMLTPVKSLSYDGNFSGDTSNTSPLKINSFAKDDTSLHSIKIFNFDISQEGSLYTPEDYYNHKRTPAELLNATMEEKALLSLDNDINEVQWKDSSANATHAVLQEETYVPNSKHAYSVAASAIWSIASSNGIFLVKDQAWIPANCKFTICAKSTSEAQFNIGDDSSTTFFDRGKTIPINWTEMGTYWNGNEYKRIRFTPTSTFQGTVEFFVEIKKLK